MRTILIVFSLTLLLVVSAGGAAGAALVVFAPLHPGETLFIAQDAAEQALVAMTRDPAKQASSSLDLLQRRTTDLLSAQDGPFEMESMRILNREIDQAVALLVRVPSLAAPALRTRLAFELVKIQQALTGLKAAEAPQAPGFSAFKDKVDILSALASDP